MKPLDKDDAKGVIVPAQGGGWVRLAWKGEKLGPERLSVEMWMASQDSGSVQRLELPLFLVEPVRVEPRLAQVGFLGQGRIKSEVEILCWSCTRRHFRLTPEVPEDDRLSPAAGRCRSARMSARDCRRRPCRRKTRS